MAEKTATASYTLQDTIYRLVQENPDWRELLTEIVAFEDAHRQEQYYQGWLWQDVHCSPSNINRMITAKIVDLVSSSRTYNYYRLRSLEDTREALGSDETEIAVPLTEPIDADALFENVVGHERVKTLLRYALKAEGAVHCLLIGPPGTAKTLILSDISRLAGAQMYLGSTTTKAGMVGMLLSYRPSFLVIDEIDKMASDDMSPLLSLMETGVVSRLQHGHYDRVTMPTRVFAGANELAKISAPITNRFARFEIPPYNHNEFLNVSTRLLTNREGLGPDMALLVAREVASHSLDIRDAVRVARMAKGHPARVPEIVACLWPNAGVRGVTPIRKERNR